MKHEQYRNTRKKQAELADIAKEISWTGKPSMALQALWKFNLLPKRSTTSFHPEGVVGVTIEHLILVLLGDRVAHLRYKQ